MFYRNSIYIFSKFWFIKLVFKNFSSSSKNELISSISLKFRFCNDYIWAHLLWRFFLWVFLFFFRLYRPLRRGISLIAVRVFFFVRILTWYATSICLNTIIFHFYYLWSTNRGFFTKKLCYSVLFCRSLVINWNLINSFNHCIISVI